MKHNSRKRKASNDPVESSVPERKRTKVYTEDNENQQSNVLTDQQYIAGYQRIYEEYAEKVKEKYDEKFDQNGNTELHKAASQGDLALVLKLIREGHKLDLLNNYGETALQLAVRAWFESSCEESLVLYNIVELLLSSRANGNIYDNRGVSPIIEAVICYIDEEDNGMLQLLETHGLKIQLSELLENKQLKLLSDVLSNIYRNMWMNYEFLIDSNADPINQSNPRSLLGMAINNDDLDTVSLLLKFGANPNEEVYKYGPTPLKLTQKYGNKDIMEALLSSNNRLDAQATTQQPSLEVVDANAKIGCVRELKF
jgi:ankyrin repeat protein